MLGRPDHVNVVVADLHAVKAFYRDVLGLEIRDEFEVSEPALSRGLGVEDAVLRVVFWSIPGSDMAVEMVEYVSPRAVAVRKAPTNRLGYGHLAFVVEDVDAAHAELLARGARFVSEPVTVAGRARFCFLHDPEGNIVELIQALPQA